MMIFGFINGVPNRLKSGLVETRGMRAPPVYRDGALSYATALMRCSGLKNQSFSLGFQKHIE
jgi:hypothetical protein